MTIQITARLEHPDGGHILSVLDDHLPALLLFLPKPHWWDVHVSYKGHTIRMTRTFPQMSIPELSLIQSLIYQADMAIP